MSHLSHKMACSACVALLPRELAEVKSKGGPGPCEFCGGQGVGGPLTWPQLNHILDARKLWRPKAGGDGQLRDHPMVDSARRGKFVHVLDVANVGGSDEGEPWYTLRISGEEPGPSSIYPAYPQSAIEEYVNTREAILRRWEDHKNAIRAMPTSEKLRLAADWLDRGRLDYAEAIAKLALSEVDGHLPRIPLPATLSLVEVEETAAAPKAPEASC